MSMVGRLMNWGAWSRDPGAVRLTVGSAEKHYVADRLRGDEAEDRIAPRVPIDIRDAKRLRDALCPTRGFDRTRFLLLAGTFVHRLEGADLVAFLRHRGVEIRRHQIDDRLGEAIVAAGEALASAHA